MINVLIIVSSLVGGYILFLTSFYFLAKLMFPKVDVSQEKEYMRAIEILEEKRRRQARNPRRQSVGFSKQAA